jgi:HAD superfamily hydrolase (TIGR01509 family)
MMTGGSSRRAVIFDCDGVLVDSEPIAYTAAARILGRHGVVTDAEALMDRFLGRPLAFLIAELSSEPGVDLDGFLPEMRAEVLAAMRTVVKPIAGIDVLLAGLGVPCCVASSSEQERVRAALTTTGLIAHFGPHIYTAEQVARPKPFPDLFLHGAARLGAAPADCVVVEDSRSGIAAALAAGMAVIGFAGGSHAARPGFREALAEAGAHAVVGDAEQLGLLLRELL